LSLAKSSLPRGVPIQSLNKIIFAEFRPEDFTKIQFSIGELPEQKIANSVFSPSPDA
jgi:hypothetical protein